VDNGSGTVTADHSYTWCGTRLCLAHNNRQAGAPVSIGYAGYFIHASSGLEFALYRAYDPTHARWLNRDPIAEAGGINLYAYVRGNPLQWNDPLGLICGVDPATGALTSDAQAALDTWNSFEADRANDIKNGNFTQAAVDENNATWARANYYFTTGQGPFPGPPPQAAPPPPPPPPQLAPVSIQPIT
jgi:RHS repeat-associated protein